MEAGQSGGGGGGGGNTADAAVTINHKTVLCDKYYTYTFVQPGRLGFKISPAKPNQTNTDPGGVKIVANATSYVEGIEPGDKLIKVAGTTVRNWSFHDVVKFVSSQTQRPIILTFQNAPLFPRPSSKTTLLSSSLSSSKKRKRRWAPVDVQDFSQQQQQVNDNNTKDSVSDLLSSTTLSELLQHDERTSKRQRSTGKTNVDSNNNNDDSKIIRRPTVTGTLFDRRYLEYFSTPLGGIHYEKLIRKKQIKTTMTTTQNGFDDGAVVVGNESTKTTTSTAAAAADADADDDDDYYLEEIADEPVMIGKTSRVGPLYNVPVPSWNDRQQEENGSHSHENGSATATTQPTRDGFECIWDPKLAEEAEQRGEMIGPFLSGEMELKARENRMTLLHQNGYSVELAIRALQSQGPSEPTSMLTQAEARLFEDVILNKKTRKRFGVVSEALHRSRVDCQIHYYKWKANSRRYRTLKQDLKTFGRYSEYCVVCEDGGDMIVCDGCGGPYHLECVNPPLKEVPDGDWYCPNCEWSRRRRSSLVTSSPIGVRKRTVHIPFSPPSPPRIRNGVF